MSPFNERDFGRVKYMKKVFSFAYADGDAKYERCHFCYKPQKKSFNILEQPDEIFTFRRAYTLMKALNIIHMFHI